MVPFFCVLVAILLFVYAHYSDPDTQPEVEGQKKSDDTNIRVDDNEVIEDMILHDMNNNDDTFDIGTIDFND